MARAFVNRGCEVTLFSSAVTGQPGDEVTEGGYRIVRRGGKLGVYREARRFWMREGQGNFDLVIDEVNTKPFGCPKWVKDVPVVALIHQVAKEIWFYEMPLLIALFGRYWLEGHWLRAYRKTPVVTVSISSMESLKSYGLTDVYVIPEGSDDVTMAPSRQMKVPDKEASLTLSFVGRLSANKRPDHAIAAFRVIRESVPDARLWVMGSGPMDEKLRRHAPEGVEFLGRVPDDVKRDRLSKSHALLVTSVREGWGLVVTESAFCGTPCYGYNVAGLTDSIRSSGGVATDPGALQLGRAVLRDKDELLAGSRQVCSGGVIRWSEVVDRILGICPSQ